MGYKLLTRPLTDEEIIRLHGMVMRNRSTPIAIRKSMAQHLVAMASADVRGYLDMPEPAPAANDAPVKTTRPRAKRIDTCELVEQAIDHGTTVSFDISSVLTRGETEVVRMTVRPLQSGSAMASRICWERSTTPEAPTTPCAPLRSAA